MPRPIRICSIDGCDKKHLANGFCEKHNRRHYRHGDPLINKLDVSLKDRFNDNIIPITETGWWIWMGSTDKKGYGRISHKGINNYAHRLSWEIHNGPIPDDLCVLHRCDIPPCVRPDHLFLGTRKDNIIDAMQKGRLKKPAPIYKKDDEEMLKLRDQGLSVEKIAKIYNVSPTNVSCRTNRYKNWSKSFILKLKNS
jgi:hypothetical protein